MTLDDELNRLEDAKCARCQNGQHQRLGKRLCDYGVHLTPAPAMRAPFGLCGTEARLFAPVRKYSEFDDE